MSGVLYSPLEGALLRQLRAAAAFHLPCVLAWGESQRLFLLYCWKHCRTPQASLPYFFTSDAWLFRESKKLMRAPNEKAAHAEKFYDSELRVFRLVVIRAP